MFAGRFAASSSRLLSRSSSNTAQLRTFLSSRTTFAARTSALRLPASSSSLSSVKASRALSSLSSSLSPFFSSSTSTRRVCASSCRCSHCLCGANLMASRTYASNADGSTSFVLSDIGEGIAEVEIIKWHIKVGDTVMEFDPLCEVQSDKATVEIPSRYNGVVTKVYYEKGDLAKTGLPLVDIMVEPEEGEEIVVAAVAGKKKDVPAKQVEAQATTTVSDEASEYNTIETSRGQRRVLATPAVRRIARENNVDLSQVAGTGKDGRVAKGDVLQFVESGGRLSAAPTSAPASPAYSAPHVPVDVAVDRVEVVRGIKRTMIKTMQAATQVPHMGYCDEVLMNSLDTVRAELKPYAAKQGVKLSHMPLMIKAFSLAMHEFPIINSSLSADQSEIIYHGNHNIGVAMATPSGLLVPNIKSVQNMSVFDIARELNRLIDLGREGKLTAGDLTGGTFSVSNIGAIGGTYAAPILMLPESTIVALGKMQTLPRFNEDGEVYAARVMNASWAADHRTIDGATIAGYSNLWKDYLESPSLMLSNLK
eukprot:TRINITY_DN3953_c0_g1_i1.p1 TRINITY_DN3953_c0_g1~~TRINITY_DN3953_c0_g1_i1.p1  ORF type:complete len:575 (+),score=132.45 TRINITY_DN3953_c0_g1_i1:115-1725(+)